MSSRATPVHRLPAEVQARRRDRLRLHRRRDPARGVSGRSPAMPCCSSTVAAIAQIPPRFWCCGDADRGAVRPLRRAASVRRRRPAGRRARRQLSRDGLLGAWNILVKGTLGVVASILLAATTTSCATCSLAWSGCTAADDHWCRSHRSCCATSTSSSTRCSGCGSPASPAAYEARYLPATRRGRALGRRAVHPLVRAGRAGLPGDAVAAATPGGMPALGCRHVAHGGAVAARRHAARLAALAIARRGHGCCPDDAAVARRRAASPSPTPTAIRRCSAST